MARPELGPGTLDERPFPVGDELDLLGARVVGGDAAEAHGEGEIRRCRLESVNLSQSRFHPLTLIDVSLHQVELSNAQWHSLTARRVELTDARAVGLGLSLDLAADLYVEQTRLDYAGIHLERARGHVVFSGCSFREARLSGDLSGVLFVDCDLNGAEFTATAANGTDLRSSRLAGARGLHSLRGAMIDVDQLITIAGQLAAEAGLRVCD
ncbi:MAG TPA: pentapeptide repeat-containing protein [Mycobacteriales bacterium]